MDLLLLRSASRNFPVDLEPELTRAGYSVSSIESLHAYIACPARARPQLLVIEIGSRADLDRALIVVDWNEHVQPLAATRYVLLMGSKHLSLGDRASRLASAEVATLPQPTRNLLFKFELQTRLLRAAPPPTPSRDVFSAKVEEVASAQHRRVLVVRGPSPRMGSWNQGEPTPSGKIRWRWVKSPGTPTAATDQFQWQVSSRNAPRFDEAASGWIAEVEDEVTCEVNGEKIYSSNPPEVVSGHEKEEQQASARSEKFITPLAATTTLRPAEPPERPEAARISASTREAAPPALKQTFPAPEPKHQVPHETSSIPLDPDTLAKARAEKHRTKKEKEANEVVVPGPAAVASAVAAVAKQKPVAVSGGDAAEPVKNAAPPHPKPEAKPTAERAQRTTAPGPGKPDQAPTAETKDPAREAKTRPTSSGVEATPVAPAAAKSPPTAKESSLRAESTAASPPEPAMRVSSTAMPEEEPAEAASALASAPTPGARKKPELLPSLGEPVPELSVSTSPAAVAPEKKPSPVRESMPESQPTPGRNWIEGEPGRTNALKTSAGSGREEGTPTTREMLSEKSAPDPVHSLKSEAETKDNSTIAAVERQAPLDPLRAPSGSALVNPKGTGVATIGPAVAESDQRSKISALAQQENEGARSFLKTRHFQLMTLEQLGDKDSSWHPMGRYRVYLSAQHRYYGLKDPSQALPLWIYDGELAPEFIEANASAGPGDKPSWKFYDCVPIRIDSLNSLPADAFEALYRLCGLEPPVEIGAQPRGSSVVVIEEAPGPAPAPTASVAPIKSEAPPEESAWGKLKRAVKGILPK